MFDDLAYLGIQLDPRVPSFATLWEPPNEHRLPLPKLAAWLTARLFGFALKTQMQLDLAVMAAAAGGALVAAR